MVGFQSRRFWVESSAIAHHYSVSEIMRSQSQKKASNLRGRMRSLSWSPHGQTLATSSHDQTAKLWDINTGQCLKTLQGHKHWVWSVAWSRDGQTLVTASYDQTIRLWDIKTGQCLKTLHGHTSSVMSVAWNRDRQTLASSSYDQTIRLWTHPVRMVKPWLVSVQTKLRSCGTPTQVNASKPCKATRIGYHQSHGVGMVKPLLLAAQMRQSSFGMWIRVSA